MLHSHWSIQNRSGSLLAGIRGGRSFVQFQKKVKAVLKLEKPWLKSMVQVLIEVKVMLNLKKPELISARLDLVILLNQTCAKSWEQLLVEYKMNGDFNRDLVYSKQQFTFKN